MEYFTAVKVNDLLTAIRSRTGEILYLAEGKDRAALIDTCVGVGHLKDFVEKLTDKPITVLLTHGHIDHAMGAPEFQEVYLNAKDLPLYREMCPVEDRKGYVKAGLGDEAGRIADADYVPAVPDYPFRKLEDGMNFDLGDLHIEAYEFPGHTPGSMVFLIREMKILILGDACNNFTFLFDGNSLSVEEYMENVDGMRARMKGKFSRVFVSHGEMDAAPCILDDMSALCRDVMEGNTDDIPFEFMGMHAYIAKKMDSSYKRADGRAGNLVYSKEHIFKG